MVPICGIGELNLLRGGVAAALQATSCALESVAVARFLVRDDSFDSKSAAVAVGHNPISVIELQPQPLTSVFESRRVDVRIHELFLSAPLMAACFSVGCLHRTDGGPSRTHNVHGVSGP